MFRNLRADEVEVKFARGNENGFSLLIYKNARVDMAMLDEAVGPMKWKREQTTPNHCKVSVYSDELKEWVSKEDYGDGKDDKSKASDSFKRACFNWGIGVELYTAPFIWVNDKSKKYLKTKVVKGETKYSTFEKFEVVNLETDENKNIIALTIVDSKGNVVFEKKMSGSITTVAKNQSKISNYKEKIDTNKTNLINYIKEKCSKEPQKSWLQKRIIILGFNKIEEVDADDLRKIKNIIDKTLKVSNVEVS